MKRTLHRVENGRIVAGVCQGLGEYLNIDPLIVRIGFVLLTVLNGFGVPLYLLAWLLMPRADASYATQEELVRRNAAEIGQRAHELGSQARGALHGDSPAGPWTSSHGSRNALVIGGIALVGVGVLMLMNSLGLLRWLSPARMLPVALIAIGAVILLNNLKKG